MCRSRRHCLCRSLRSDYHFRLARFGVSHSSTPHSNRSYRSDLRLSIASSIASSATGHSRSSNSPRTQSTSGCSLPSEMTSDRADYRNLDYSDRPPSNSAESPVARLTRSAIRAFGHFVPEFRPHRLRDRNIDDHCLALQMEILYLDLLACPNGVIYNAWATK